MNKYKKADANGNQLPEQIGKGLTPHWDKIKDQYREPLDDIITFKISKKDKQCFEKLLEMNNLDKSKVLRAAVKEINNELK